MDITRHWRLKMSRSHMAATRCPVSGRVVLAQQGMHTCRAARVYVFEGGNTQLYTAAAAD